MDVTDTRPVWDRLPGHLRRRDAEAGGVLDAVVAVLEAELARYDDDLDALADDWFIETCAEWVVPYIGALVGVTGLHPLAGRAAFSNRARVADTIRFRRRKGTAAMLEELARSTTGWTARAVEEFEQLVWTQHLDHVRLDAPATADVRDQNAMELVTTPFSTAARTVDVRPMGAMQRRPNLDNIALHVWPMPSYPLDRQTAAPAGAAGRHLVDPLGVEHTMVGPTVAEPDIDHRADEHNTPSPLRRRPLHDELNARRVATTTSAPLVERWFGDADPAFVVWVQESGGTLDRVPLDLVHVCDLSDWNLPTGDVVRVDPVLGRVAVSAARPVERVAVSWHYAFSGDIGAGPYPRRATSIVGTGGPDGLADAVDFQIGVGVTDDPGAGEIVDTLGTAVDAWALWEASHPGTRGRIVITDSHRYVEDLVGAGRITVGPGSRLDIVAARWPKPAGGPRRREQLEAIGVRPVIVGNVEVEGVGETEQPGELWIEGVVLHGRLTVVPPAGVDDLGLGGLHLRNVSIPPLGLPGVGTTTISAGNARTDVSVSTSLVGPLLLADATSLHLGDSLVHDPHGGVCIDAPAADASIDGCTALGRVAVRSLDADDSIFAATVSVTRRQLGCIRFSWVDTGTPVAPSTTPRRYRCQPDLAVAAAGGDTSVVARLAPAWVSDHPAAAGYGRLVPATAVEIATGAEEGSEMGVFRSALGPHRLANIAAALGEYLPMDRVAAPIEVLPLLGDQP